jgi:hypothetical protein
MARTADQRQLDAPDDGIDVEMGHVKLLFQLGLVDVRPLVGHFAADFEIQAQNGGLSVWLLLSDSTL